MLYRAQIGTTASSDFNELPTTYRFFAGGDQSIRGFDYESISPINDDGDLVGGKHQAIGSIEFEHQIASQWAVAAFTDFGDAFSEELDFKYSVGAGVRWFSPIGPIRVDLGVPINEDTKDFRLHVTIGPDL
jgi:translocation and assembly module TamA